MAVSGNTTDRDQISALLRKINEAWPAEHIDELNTYFDDAMVIVDPSFRVLASDRAACVKSYADFVNSADIDSFELAEPDVQVWGDTAVGTYSYQIAWRMRGQSHHETGRDLFVLRRVDGEWKAVWRQIYPG